MLCTQVALANYAAGDDRRPAVAAKAVLPRLSRTILLPGVAGPVERNGIAGRLDHMAYDAATNRLFLAAFSKGSFEVIDLKKGKLIKTVPGILEAQGVAVVPGDKSVQKLYSIRDVVQMLPGIKEHNLAYAHRTGRIPEPQHVAGKRIYSQADVFRIATTLGIQVKEAI